jgi:4-amino-4-deoxy-L-arabinose transferase-like glycosyltransferase
MSGISSFSPQRHTAIFILVLLTVLKMGVFLALDAKGVARPFVGDNAKQHYLPIGSRLLAEGRFNGPDSRPDSKVPPGYPLMIAAAMKLAGTHALAALVLMQLLADGATAILLFELGRRITSGWGGLLSGIAWLFLPPAVAISGWVTAETPFTLLLTCGIAACILALEEDGGWFAVAAGVAFGIATLFRPTPLMLPICLFPAFLRHRQFRRWLLAVAIMMCLILPWTYRNWVVLHDFIPVSVGSGSTLLQGSDERFFTGPGKQAYYPATFEAARAAGIHKPAEDRESAIDGWMARVGRWIMIRRLQERPLSAVPFAMHKFLRLWYGAENASPAKELLVGICSLLIVPAGLWQTWRSRLFHPGPAWILLGVFFYFIALHMVFLPEIRYMLPVYPFAVLQAMSWYLQHLGGVRTQRPGLRLDGRGDVISAGS